MRRPFDPGARPEGVEALLGEVPVDFFDDRFHAACELVDRYATDLALEIAARLGLEAPLVNGATAAELESRLGFTAHYRPALESVLARLAQAGELAAEGEPPRYRAPGALRGSDREALRALGAGLGTGLEASFDLLDAAADAHPAVARGAAGGEQLLLAPERIGLWLRYFDNANRTYAVSNDVAAVAATNRLRPGGGLRLMEVGAGAGSAALRLLAELERRGRLGDVALYELTEPSPFFRRRAQREVAARHPELPLRCRSFDLDRPAEEQGGDFGRYDLVFGVNVLHVARRLDEAISRLRDLLAPGGWLVAGECCRLVPGQAVPADLVFELLDSFTRVELDARRPRHGFLAPETWRAAFAAASFEAVELVPDVERIRDLYPRFFAAAVCGRHRSVESEQEDAR